MSEGALLGDLGGIEVENGVNEDGVPFLSVRATGEGRRGRSVALVGQLPPETVRTMAMDWLGAAEAAEQDAAVLRVLRRLELPDELAGLVVTELRNSR